MKGKAFIFIGRSGSGKGTQAQLLRKFIENKTLGQKVFYHETGALFRELIKENSYTAIRAKKVLDEGRRQPDFLAVWIWSRNFINNITGEEIVIIDGTPRSLMEAKILDTAIKSYDWDATVVYIKLSRESARDRMLKRGRNDDNNDYINSRLDWFEKDVEPAIDFYKKGKSVANLVEIDGEKSIEDIFKELISKIAI